MSSRLRFSLDISLEYIQSIRLVQALVEAGGEVHCGDDAKIKFGRLRELFLGIPAFGPNMFPILPNVTIDHASPVTKVGRVSRPLIFPHSMFNYLRDRWPTQRQHRVTFAGLLTQKRILTINKWLATYNADVSPLRPPGFGRRIVNRINARFDRDSTLVIRRSDVLIWSSNKGRHFPVKAWDSDYFSLLLNSQFVLCPNGDYVWSYRFIEAVLCGAIPIVEDDCTLFDGFRYLHMGDALDGVKWSREDAEANFALAHERVAAPNEELLAEMQLLIAKAMSRQS